MSQILSVCYGCGDNITDTEWERMPFHAISETSRDVTEWREQRLHVCGAILAARVSEVAFARPTPWSTATHLAMNELIARLEERQQENQFAASLTEIIAVGEPIDLF